MSEQRRSLKSLGKGGQLAKAAGAVAKLIAKEGKLATLKLPSREVRLISKNCSATVEQVALVSSTKITRAVTLFNFLHIKDQVSPSSTKFSDLDNHNTYSQCRKNGELNTICHQETLKLKVVALRTS
ncbi:Ribosomal protein L2, C-terminal [Dillenia turbinata]|uniref:Ribosomal protein L2, C-terminal n=1 Tax=Dillenia turbinata TaxID=194707 RepID=A0AAN8V175_9MAGN